MRSVLVLIDAVIKLILGTVLVAFPMEIFQLLGLPLEMPPFYANILGALLMGISIVLLAGLTQSVRPRQWLTLDGVVVLNMFVLLALVALLVSGRVYAPLLGHVILWALAVLLTILTLVEGLVSGRGK
jgi:hypothetical protein